MLVDPEHVTEPPCPPSPAGEQIVRRLREVYPSGADPDQAVRQAAYLRDQFPFLGLPTPGRRALSRTVLSGAARPDQDVCASVALRAWRLPEREYQYFAVDYLRRHVKVCDASFLPVAAYLIVTRSWWDTVDHLAAHVVGRLVAADPTLTAEMDRWITATDLWLARTALLHQLTYRQDTDAERLFDYCRIQSGHRDFFVRKAIGWALRTYATTDPDAVRSFLAAEGNRLSPLSIREAAKHLG
ncbi:DNA alkylation repair protein [Streptacidiphilus jiangxiensis]|uniref:3-methyladenine DNA glycosylase AlkD n=1 Tax=Streptacidiphilus jiangxiensis TaxID=235985 RepID=A0A1H7HW20_STRJI|nr:DNA alkylation repair protein [Streptacidiphilus jiangxiensis]SEK54368.1 3-methyladenine DNA glycosylase AlkD [Streptacidiphilus jiangxiensis]